MGFPPERELNLNKDGYGNENTTTWEWELLMLVGPKIIPAALLNNITLHFVLFVCGFHTKAHSVIYFCLL